MADFPHHTLSSVLIGPVNGVLIAKVPSSNLWVALLLSDFLRQALPVSTILQKQVLNVVELTFGGRSAMRAIRAIWIQT